MKTPLLLTLSLLAVCAPLTSAFAHCQIPCGIYDDKTVFSQMALDVETIQKSMESIDELSKEKSSAEVNNQLVRWVNNKETHANNIEEVAAQYFLAQRIKADQPDYQKRLELLHGIIVAAMTTKQTVDPANASKLGDLVSEFEKIYFKK